MNRLLTILFLLLALSAGAANVWITQNGSGATNGTDLANAQTIGWIDSGTTVNPGDIIHLSGSFNFPLLVHNSGVSNNPITIHFESNAVFSASTWPVYADPCAGAIGMNGQSWVIIDGGVNGMIECTDNGTSFGNQVASYGVQFANSSHITIKNLRIRNIYVRTPGTDASVGAQYSVGVFGSCPSTTITDCIVSNCVISDAMMGISVDYGPACSNFVFAGNTISNCNHSIRTPDRNASSVVNGIYIHHNQLSGWKNWDQDSNDNFHHNGIYCWADNGGHMTNVQVYANTFGPGYGGANQTAGCFFSGGIYDLMVYNNLFVAATNEYCGNGFITAGIAGNSQTYNNTIIGGGPGTAINNGAGSGTHTIENNLSGNCNFLLFNYAVSSTLISDYNLSYGFTTGQQFSFSTNSSSVFKTTEEWHALGYDVHSITNSPTFNSDKSLTTGSAGIGAGTNLHSLDITTDFYGNPRPSTGPWTIGAFEAGTNQPTISATAFRVRFKSIQ